VHDTVFYCVANMPSAVPKTSTYALTNATMPYVLRLADQGWRAACRSDPALAKGLSTHQRALLSARVAADLSLPFTEASNVLA
jgi:alanine dehydrogenase